MFLHQTRQINPSKHQAFLNVHAAFPTRLHETANVVCYFLTTTVTKYFFTSVYLGQYDLSKYCR